MICNTFLVRTQKLYLFPEVEKEKKLNLQNFRTSVRKLFIFCSAYKMINIVYIQHKYHSSSSKNCSLLFSTQKFIHKVVASRFFESTSGQLMFYLRNSRTSFGFLRENIFKTDIGTTLSYLSGVFF